MNCGENVKKQRNGFKLTAVAAILAAQVAYGEFTYPNCTPLQASDFKEVILVDKSKDPTLNEPVGFSLGKDGRIFFAERGYGNVKTVSPTGQISIMGNFEVYDNNELGLRFVTPDPNFEANRWLYLILTPKDPKVNRLIRVKVKGDWTLDMSTVKIMLDMPWTYDICCHQGGALAWDLQGNLFVSTGNNTQNSDDFNVTDERTVTKDNQGGPANTNSYRGKILRIKPIPFADSDNPGPGLGKSYTVPAGNLRDYYLDKGVWNETESKKVLPELYTMGHRNPYSMNVDKYTGWLSWGDIGPDAGIEKADRGPAGNDEFNLVNKPVFAGWPYFVGANLGYKKWNYETGTSLNQGWDVNAPMNESKNNTGVTRLPPAYPAILPESKQVGVTPLLSQEGGGTAAISGPVYHYDGSNPSKVKLPPHFDGKWFVGEFSRNWIKVASFDGDLTKITDLQNLPFNAKPAAMLGMELGSDGALYVLNYAGWFNSTAETRISRIEYNGNCSDPSKVPKLSTSIASRKNLTEAGIRVLGERINLGDARGVQLFDLRGRMVWSATRANTTTEGWVTIPEQFRSGLYQVRMITANTRTQYP